MTDLEKRIYNTFIRIYRSRQNQPYKLRKDFDDFEKSDNYHFVRKLGMFFTKHNKISIDTYFAAPYEIYTDSTTGFDLQFYISPKAIKAYSLYNKKRDQEPVDSDIHIKHIKESLFYIYKFCKDNNIHLDEYIDHKTNDIHTFILHIQSREVSVYVLLCLEKFDTMIYGYTKDMLSFIIEEDFYEKRLDIFRTRLYTSSRIKNIIMLGLKHISEHLTKPTN